MGGLDGREEFTVLATGEGERGFRGTFALMSGGDILLCTAFMMR